MSCGERPEQRLVHTRLNRYYLLSKDGTVTEVDGQKGVAEILGITQGAVTKCPDGKIYRGYRMLHSKDFDKDLMLKMWDCDKILQDIPNSQSIEVVAIDLDTEKAMTINCPIRELAKIFGTYDKKLKSIIACGGVVGNKCWLYSSVYDRMVENKTLKDYIMTVRYIIKCQTAYETAWKRRAKLIDSASGI